MVLKKLINVLKNQQMMLNQKENTFLIISKSITKKYTGSRLLENMKPYMTRVKKE